MSNLFIVPSPESSHESAKTLKNFQISSFCVFRVKKFDSAFSSHENFFTRELRRLLFLHTRIALPAFSSHENSVACFFFTRESRCRIFLHTRIPLPVFSSHENSVACFSHKNSVPASSRLLGWKSLEILVD